jgi:hypothetical protein
MSQKTAYFIFFSFCWRFPFVHVSLVSPQRTWSVKVQLERKDQAFASTNGIGWSESSSDEGMGRIVGSLRKGNKIGDWHSCFSLRFHFICDRNKKRKIAVWLALVTWIESVFGFHDPFIWSISQRWNTQAQNYATIAIVDAILRPVFYTNTVY